MTQTDHAPVAIVGAGPAGIAAAVWLHSLNLEFAWYGEQFGGTLDRVYNALHNYPGLRADNGHALARHFRDHIDELDLEPVRRHITAIRRGPKTDATRWILYSDGPGADEQPTRVCDAEAVIVATGTEYRRLNVPGEAEGLGRHVSQSVAREAESWADQTVAMVGGGDSGFEGSLRLSEQHCRVHMLLRSEPKARSDFRDRVRRDPNIMVHPIPTVVNRIEPLPFDRGARLHVTTRDNSRTLEVACLFVRIGVDPTKPDIEPVPSTDDAGYIGVDNRQCTDRKGLYAAGDVTDSILPAVATAVGDGARAAEAAAKYLGHK